MHYHHDFSTKAANLRWLPGNAFFAFTKVKCLVVLGVCLNAMQAFGQDP
jgi:hypothetical protein